MLSDILLSDIGNEFLELVLLRLEDQERLVFMASAESLAADVDSEPPTSRYDERRPTTVITAVSIFFCPILLCSVGKRTTRPLRDSRADRSAGDVFRDARFEEAPFLDEVTLGSV